VLVGIECVGALGFFPWNFDDLLSFPLLLEDKEGRKVESEGVDGEGGSGRSRPNNSFRLLGCG